MASDKPSHSRTSSATMGGNSSGGSGSHASSFAPVNRGRGYKLTTPSSTSAATSVSNAAASTTNNTDANPTANRGKGPTSSPTPSTAPAPIVLPTSTTPPIPSSHSTTTSTRNALGITPGWGVGLSHSGSYLSTHVRTSSTIPLLSEETSTYNAIKSMLHKTKLLEIAAAKEAQKLRQAKLASQSKKSKREQEKKKRKLLERKESRERAEIQLERNQSQLTKLLAKRTEMEQSIKLEWQTKIENYKQKSMQDEKEETRKLKEDHDKEMERLMEEAKVENAKDEAKLKELLGGDGKGTNEDGASEGNEPASKKQKLNDKGEKSSFATNTESETKVARSESKESESDLDKELFGCDDDDDVVGEEEQQAQQQLQQKTQQQGETGSIETEKKKEELKKIMDEVNDLNKTKSQMIWLLKQVITAEKKRSDEINKT